MQGSRESFLGVAVARTLQQASVEAVNATTVSTPAGLRDAVQSGVLDIVITEHLDLTTIPLLATSICEVGCESPLGEITATRSIRVRHDPALPTRQNILRMRPKQAPLRRPRCADRASARSGEHSRHMTPELENDADQ